LIIYVSGAYGVGKTTTVRYLAGLLPGSAQFDAEALGFFLKGMLPNPKGVDFQDLAAFRELTAATAVAMEGEVAGAVLMHLTVLNRSYFEEILGRLARRSSEAYHVILDADTETLRERIQGHEMFPDDPERSAQVRQWRLRRVHDFLIARSWLADVTCVVDSTGLTPAEVASRVLQVVRSGGAAVPHRDAP
jgi:energy-coupling factor transporter ATP-binding protein EcfA2